MEPLDVWIVEHVSICTGSRIEGFNVKFAIFTDESKALRYAQDLAKKRINKKIEYNEDGKYVTDSSGGYDDWPDDEITVRKKEYDPTKDVALELGTGA